MRNERRPRRSLSVTALTFIVIAGLSASCVARPPYQPCGPTASEGAENRRAVVNVKELADEEARNPPPARTPRAIHRPLPGPPEGQSPSSGCPEQAAPSARP
jgi:hypothetical protein